MAEKNYPRLRAMGDWGGHLANVFTFLTTNWPVTLAGLAALGTAINKWLWGVVVTPVVYATVGVFLAVLWTIIGLTVLIDRRRPRRVQTHLDYRYGLTFEGIEPQFISTATNVPQAGCLGFGVQVRNFSPGPIHYRLEAADVRLGSRSIAKYATNKVSGYMARGAGRTSTPGSFKAADVKEFYGAGLAEGTADFTFAYGPPDGEPIRRLKISLEIAIALPKDGELKNEPEHRMGFNHQIISEIDEAV